MRLPERHSRAWDAALGLLVAAIGVVELAGLSERVREGPVWANVAVLLAYGGLIGLRRRLPVVSCYGFVGVIVVLALGLTPAPEITAIFVGLLIVPYTAGSHLRGPASAAVLPAVFAGIAIANLAADETASGDWLFPPAIAAAAWFAGRNVVDRARLAAELHEAGLQAEEARVAETRRAVADERRRIAREMHDVVAHSISVMVVQAGGARRILERDAERAAQAAELVERTGRETLAEMRRLLGVMREPEAPAERRSAPTLADLAALVGSERLAVLGRPRPVPAGLELGAYRIVEDLLDDDGVTAVVVEWTADDLHLTVSGPSVTVPDRVRERVALYDGGVDAVPDRVHVRIPLHDQDSTAPVAAQGTA